MFWKKNDKRITHNHTTHQDIDNQVTATYRSELVISENAPGAYTCYALNRNIMQQCSGNFDQEALVPSTIEIHGKFKPLTY